MRSSVNKGALRRRVLSAVALGAVAAVTLTACGSSSSKPGGSSGASSSSAPTSSAVTAAKAVVSKYEAKPTALNITTPLKTAPPKGKTFVWLTCEISACTTIGKGVHAATEAAGWTYKSVSYKQADTSTLIAALKTALTLHPTVVGLSGLPEAVWQSVLPAYKAAGVRIIAGYVGPLKTNSTIIGNVSGPPEKALDAKIMASWFIADSDGKGSVLNVRTDDLPILKSFSDAFETDVKAQCSGCTVTDLNTSVTEAVGGQVNGAVVAELQSHPSIGYVMATEGPFVTGLPAALSAAGLSKVKVAGSNAGVENLTNVKNGSEQAFTGASLLIGGWEYVDIALRWAEGMTFDPSPVAPQWLLTKSVDFTPADDIDEPANYPALFKQLWKVGS
jgi:ribose transport system substrate-binding protein